MKDEQKSPLEGQELESATPPEDQGLETKEVPADTSASEETTELAGETAAETTREASPDASGLEATAPATEKHSKPVSPPLWQRKGFTSEEAFEKSFDETRRAHTQSRQELAMKNARIQALQDINTMNVTPDDPDAYVREKEEEARVFVRSRVEQEERAMSDVADAIQWGQGMAPEIVTEKNAKILNGFALQAPPEMNTPIKRMGYAIDQYKQEIGLPEATRTKVKEKQEEMKGKAKLPTVTRPQAEIQKDAWDESPDEFQKKHDAALQL